MKDNKEIVVNSYVSNYNGIKRGTIWFDGKKAHISKVYNAKAEIKSNIKWAISGCMLYPTYDPASEGFTGAYSDILRKCNHTAIGYKDNKVYLIVAKDMYLKDFRNNILNSSIAFEGLINLDGGGSTQMRYNGSNIISSSRVLNHSIIIR